MNYIITAAGNGERFKKEGIKTPKPLIKVKNDELLIWSLTSFNFKKNDNLFIISIKSDQLKKRIKKKLIHNYPMVKIFWIEIEKVLNGQLYSARRVIEKFNIKGQIIIHNCDTSYICPELITKLNAEKLTIFGIIPCFNSLGENWSFVKSDPSNYEIAIEVKEKNRISDNCSVGTYAFSSSEEFYNLSGIYLRDLKSKKEKYIAPFYDFAIKKGKIVKIIKANKVKVFGTIKELLETFKISKSDLIFENENS